jgi:hypothetical protein
VRTTKLRLGLQPPWRLEGGPSSMRSGFHGRRCELRARRPA